MTLKQRRLTAPRSKYQRSEAEEVVVQRIFRRMASRTAPRMIVTPPGILPKIVLDHPDQAVAKALLMDAIGTQDPDFLRGLVTQLFNVSLQGGPINESDLYFMLSVIKDIQPKDQTEAMLAAQMAVAHLASMRCAQHLLSGDTKQRENAERAFCRFTRVYATHMEALERHRSHGKRRGTVPHGSVQEGGQAIAGNVPQSSPALSSEEIEFAVDPYRPKGRADADD